MKEWMSVVVATGVG